MGYTLIVAAAPPNGVVDERNQKMTTDPRGAGDPLVIAGRSFHSRLLAGTGKFPSPATMADALAASQTQIVQFPGNLGTEFLCAAQRF